MNEPESGGCPPIDVRAIRDSFATFCGARQYDKFLRELNTFGTREGRLRHWQEVLWDRFATNLKLALTFAQLQTIFRVCAIHSRDLTLSSSTDDERVLEYEAALDTAPQFIHARGTWYCQDCWSAFLEWERRHPLTLAKVSAGGEELRVFRLAYDHYSVTRIAVAEVDGATSDEWLLFSNRVRAGDELWRLRSPEESWRGLCGSEYVALVRCGRIVSIRITAMN